tara:strand:+ start:50 stop:403 length:354 start_codon:yes stop_codon:yes gene_type:complete
MSKTRYEEMRAQCEDFHKQYPEVWEMLKRFSDEMKNKGFKHYSINGIFERIRWEKDIGGDGVTQFKLNNNYRAFYARRFMRVYPEYAGFFRLREQISNEASATELPELTPADYEDVR